MLDKIEEKLSKIEGHIYKNGVSKWELRGLVLGGLVVGVVIGAWAF